MHCLYGSVRSGAVYGELLRSLVPALAGCGARARLQFSFVHCTVYFHTFARDIPDTCRRRMHAYGRGSRRRAQCMW